MLVGGVNRRTWKWFAPTLIGSIMCLAYIFYSTRLDEVHAMRRLSSSGAYAVYQSSAPGRPDLAGRADASNTPLQQALTIVTGFLPATAHTKDTTTDSGDPYTRWMEWSKLYRNMSNPVIAYLGSVQYMFYFESVRGRRAITDTNMTMVTLKDLDIYKLKPKIEALLPKSGLQLTADQILHQHAKYELLLHAATHNPFRTTHMIYLDPRDFTAAYPNDHTFKVLVPANFDVTRVAYRTFNKFESFSVAEIFRDKRKYLEGDFLLGATQTLAQWSQAYLKAFSTYLEHGYIGTDETTVYAMIADTQSAYRDMVNTYPAADPGFAQWYQKMGGTNQPYSKRKKRDTWNR